jgi:HK97 family phage major capsid protein
MDQAMAQKIADNVEKMLAQQEASESAFEARNKLLMGKVEVLDEKLTAAEEKIQKAETALQLQEEWIGKVERKASATRFGGASGLGETDALRNLLPDHLRGQIALVETHQWANDHLAKLAEKDPVRLVGSAAWFMCRIKQFRLHQESKYQEAHKFAEKADKLAEALGGYQRAALQEDTNAEGGFLIPTVTEADLGRVIKDNSVVQQAGPSIIQMTTKTHQLPTQANDFTVAIVAEETAAGDAAPATPFGQGTLTAKKFIGIVTMSEELVGDAAINLMDFLFTHLAEMIGRTYDAQSLEGDGTGSNFTGLFAAAGVNSTAVSGALTEAALRKLLYGGEQASTLNNGVIFAHPWVMRDALGLAVTSGNPWFPVVFGVAQQGNGRPTNIWGQPVFLTTAILRNRGGGTNETTAYHGDPRGIVFGYRSGMSFMLDPYTNMANAQIRLRVMSRTGILVWVPAKFTKATAIQVTA